MADEARPLFHARRHCNTYHATQGLDDSPTTIHSKRPSFPIHMSFANILLLKGFRTDFWVLSYTWFNLLVTSSLVLGSVVILTAREPLVEAASFLSAIFALYIFYQRRLLHQLGTFRSLHNQMRNKINDFMLENNKLTCSINRLEASISGIQNVELGLRQVCKTDQVDAFVHCVSKTKILNEKIKENIQTRIIQDLLTSILRTDRNNDLLIDKGELDRLMVRLSMMPGFDFHEDRFVKVLGRTPTKGSYISIAEMMQVFRNLLDHDIPEYENVFVLKPKQILSY